MYDYDNDFAIPEESRKNMDLPAIEEAVRTILKAIGEDPDREGLLETPQRVARMYAEVFSGLHRDVSKDVKVFNEKGNDEMILIGDIPFYSMCEHQMLPFFGKIHVAYLPKGRIVGLSKIPRIVEMFARRLQIQERLTSQIAKCLMENLKPYGVGVVCEANHLCMAMRGVQKSDSFTTTSAMEGTFKTDGRTRHEFLKLISMPSLHR